MWNESVLKENTYLRKIKDFINYILSSHYKHLSFQWYSVSFTVLFKSEKNTFKKSEFSGTIMPRFPMFFHPTVWVVILNKLRGGWV